MDQSLYIKQLEEQNQELLELVGQLREEVYLLDKPMMKVSSTEVISPSSFINGKHYNFTVSISQEKIEDILLTGGNIKTISELLLKGFIENVGKSIQIPREVWEK